MKKVEYIVDSFKDFTGEERQFVMAAVSLHGEPEVYIEEDGLINHISSPWLPFSRSQPATMRTTIRRLPLPVLTRCISSLPFKRWSSTLRRRTFPSF